MTSPEINVAALGSATGSTRRITLRRVGSVALGFLLAAVILCALLPWLIPKRWLADRVAADIAMAMNRAARIDGMRLGWVDGVVIEGLTIDRRPGFGNGPFVRVRRIQTEFSPLRALLGKPLGRLDLESPEVWVVIVTENGVQRLNIADLGAEGTEAKPPKDWSASQAAVHIVEERVPPSASTALAGEEAMSNEVELRLGQLACHLDPQTGQAQWDIRGELPSMGGAGASSTRPSGPGGGETSGGGLSTDGSLTMPTLKSGVKLSGGGRIAWERLDLATLPVQLIPGSTLQRLTGWSAGMLDVRVHEDLHVDVEFRTNLSDVAVYRKDRDRPERLASADISAKGQWNPSADVLVFNGFDCHLPGLRVEAQKRPDDTPIRFALHGERRVDLHLAGKVDDIGQLRRSVPELDALFGRETTSRGACTFEVSWRRMTTGDRLRLELDASDMEVRRPDAFYLPAGEPASLRLDASVDHAGDRLQVRDLRARVGPMSAQLNVEMPLRPVPSPTTQADPDRADRALGSEEGFLRRFLHETRGELRVSTQAADRLCEILPCLAGPLRDVRLAGAMNLAMGLEPTQGESATTTLRGNVSVPASSVLKVGEQFAKPDGEALSAAVELALAHEPEGVLREIGLDVRCGGGRAWLDPSHSNGRIAVQRLAEGSHTTTATGTAPGEPGYMAHAYVSATLQVEKIESLLAMTPKVVEGLRGRQDGKGLTGNCKLAVETNLANVAMGQEMRPELWRVHADVDTTDLGVDFGDDFRKPSGKRSKILFDYFFDGSLPRLPHRSVALMDWAGLAGQAVYEWGAGCEQARIDVDAFDVPEVLAYLPGLAGKAEPYRPRGGVSLRLQSERGPKLHVVRIESNATRLGVHLPGTEPIDKSPGVPCAFVASLESLPGGNGDRPHEMTIREVVASLASCELRATEGRVVARPGTHEMLTGDYMARHPRWWLTTSPFQELRLATTGKIVFDATLRSLSPAIERLAKRYDLIGSADAALRLEADPDGVRLAGSIEAERLNINASPHLIKPPGTQLTLTLDVASRERPDQPGTTTGFVVHECGLRAWDMQVAGSGDFWLQHGAEAGLPRFGGFALSARCEVPHLNRLQKLVPALLEEPLSGSVEGEVSLAAEGDHFRLGPSSLTAKGVRTKLGQQDVQLDGRVSVSSEHVESEGLDVQLGSNRFKLAGHVDDPSHNPRGSVFIIADELDLDEIRRLPEALSDDQEGPMAEPSGPVGPGGRVGSGAASSRPGPSATRPAVEATTDEAAMAEAQPIFDFLKRCDLTGRLHIGRATVTGEKIKQAFAVDALVSDFKVVAGRVVVPFRCALNGGLVDGEFSMTADRPNPYFDLKYKAAGVQAEDNIKAFVLYDFPGLHASGPVTLIDSTHQRFFNEPGVDNHPVGEGDWIIEGGAYVGRAAPMWLARIFPGLNTARYEFTRMHDWFRKYADGRVDHHMIYQGSVYNIYMKGHSMVPTGRSQYEVGIDLLAGYESKYWSETGQGRVALFTADARVQDGVEVEKIIRFVPLHRVVYDVFLRSNVVTAAYYALKKQVQGQQ
ncbi:MAG: hypothetical protein JXQ73_03275 [Phycisphaerae bacterium]|nr:hypothetical protein [Phycisphaerae bacterium]